MVCREDRFDEDLKKVRSLIWGQCTELLRAKLQAKDGHDQMTTECDTIELLKSIKDCVFKFSDQKKAAHSLHEALRKFHNGHQERSSNAQDHHQRFKNHVEVAEHCGGSLGKHQGLIDKKLEERGLSIVTCSIDEHREAITDSREECLACAFLLGSDWKRCGKLIEDSENDHVQRNGKQQDFGRSMQPSNSLECLDMAKFGIRRGAQQTFCPCREWRKSTGSGATAKTASSSSCTRKMAW
jgi:hypothetical protein